MVLVSIPTTWTKITKTMDVLDTSTTNTPDPGRGGGHSHVGHNPDHYHHRHQPYGDNDRDGGEEVIVGCIVVGVGE